MKNKKMWLMVGVAAVIIAMIGAVAMAAVPGDVCFTQMDKQHQMMLDQLVKEDVISVEQAAKIQNKLSATMSQHINMPEMMNNKMGGVVNAAGCCSSQQVNASK